MTCFSDVFIQQITCICANNTVNKKKSNIQKQWAALSGPEKTKENCRHASAETSKAFSLQGKYLKANIQLTLLLLQTPVTSRCSILACRFVQCHTDRCLDKNIFLYSQQDAFWRKRSDTAPGLGGGDGGGVKLAFWSGTIWRAEICWLILWQWVYCAEGADSWLLINHFDFSGILFFFFAARVPKTRVLFIVAFRFFCVNIISGIERVEDSLNRSLQGLDQCLVATFTQNLQVLIRFRSQKEKKKKGCL